MEANVTFKKLQTGIFQVLLNGEDTGHQVINGSLGMTGRDSYNMYGVTDHKDYIKWVGPIRTAKSLAAARVTKLAIMGKLPSTTKGGAV